MNDSDTRQIEDERIAARLGTVLRRSVWAIRWEMLWRAFWAPLGVLVLFVGLALTDVLPALPATVHGAVLAFLAVLFGFSVIGATSVLRPIDGEEASRRVETASGLSHRPLTALIDQPAASKLSSESKALWQAHVLRALAQTKQLRTPLPKPGVAGLDPWGLRFVPVLVLFVGLLMGASDPLPRFERALSPTGGAGASAQVRMDLWITPPAYTGLAPLAFQGIGAPVEDEASNSSPPELIVPVGSQILVHAVDAPYQPTLELGEKSLPLPQLGDAESASYKLELEVGSDATAATYLGLNIGGSEIAGWPVRISPDSAPTIEYTRVPTRRRDTQLDVSFLATDDYGVQRVEMAIRRPGGQPWPGGETAIVVEVPVSGDRRNVDTSWARDFSAHPWAGLPVKVQLTVTDTASQTAQTEAAEVVLPERIFNHPVARSLAEARKALNDFSPDVIEAVAADVHELSRYPMRFFDDTVAFLAIRFGHSRLVYGEGDGETIASVQRLFWETALRIEDGEFALAESDLMRMQQEAMDALRDGKLGEELSQVMRELQEAMDRYMQALADRLQEMGLDDLPPMANQQQMQSQDLQEMLDRIQEMAQTGNREAAEQMLAQMQQMLEQMRQGLQMQQNNPAMAEAQRVMDQLRSLTEDQQQLLDRTFQESREREGPGALQPPNMAQRPQQGQQQGQRQGQQRGQQQGQQQGQQRGQQQGQQQGQEGQQGSPNAADQEALRRRLGELMMQMDEAFGQIPDNMGRAEQQMEQAGRNMGKGEFRDATGNQTQALQELRDATNQMAEAMAQQFGAQVGMQSGNQPQNGQRGFDPFGRRDSNENGQGQAVEDADVQLPNEFDVRRSREIIDELRRRSGQQHRPQIELDYIDRLLDIF